MDTKTRIVIIHGANAREKAEELSKNRELVIVESSHYTSFRGLMEEKRSVVVWGPLYTVDPERVRSTLLFDYLPYADEVHRVDEECEECQTTTAQLLYKNVAHCQSCAQNKIERAPPIMMFDGTVTSQELKNGDISILVSIANMPMRRKREGTDVVYCLSSAIASIDEAMTGPGIRRYSLTTPRSISEHTLEKVSIALQPNILIEWK